jgi:transcription initiation factor TFIIIB Brf1 subunit/transcription initiation factor TFIIB
MANKSLYETDFAAWTDTTASLIRAGRFTEVDAANVAEEIESLGNRDRKAIRAQLQRLMMHKIKQILQPERDNASWHASIRSARADILDEILDSPSLKRHLRENLQRVYRRAVDEALEETRMERVSLPPECPWDLDVLLGS